MIIDQLNNVQSGFYPALFSAADESGLAQRLSAGFAYLQNADLAGLEPGRVEIDGDQVFAFVQEYTSKPMEQGRWEAHVKYIDIQYIVSGEEQIGYANVADSDDGRVRRRQGPLCPARRGQFRNSLSRHVRSLHARRRPHAQHGRGPAAAGEEGRRQDRGLAHRSGRRKVRERRSTSVVAPLPPAFARVSRTVPRRSRRLQHAQRVRSIHFAVTLFHKEAGDTVHLALDRETNRRFASHIRSSDPTPGPSAPRR